MDAQLKKGILDALVLAVLRDGETYGYELTERIAGVVELSETALYPVLRRLETLGFLATRSVEHNGRLRRYYGITETGRERFEAYRAELAELERVIGFITKGEADHGKGD
jgi:PadR family transcriptional regulator PadR